MTKDEALKLLTDADIFYPIEEEEDEDEKEFRKQNINLNDTFSWGSADCEKVEDDELVEVARLFREYGWCGVLYWVSQKRGGLRSEFLDNNRFIDFVKNEEDLLKKEPDTDKRAYLKYSYTLG